MRNVYEGRKDKTTQYYYQAISDDDELEEGSAQWGISWKKWVLALETRFLKKLPKRPKSVYSTVKKLFSH